LNIAPYYWEGEELDLFRELKINENTVDYSVGNITVDHVTVDLQEAEVTVESKFALPLGNLQSTIQEKGAEYKNQPKNKAELNKTTLSPRENGVNLNMRTEQS